MQYLGELFFFSFAQNKSVEFYWVDDLFIFEMICRERHSEEYCAMYDICGAREDGKVLNCPYGSPSVKVSGFSLFFFFF